MNNEEQIILELENHLLAMIAYLSIAKRFEKKPKNYMLMEEYVTKVMKIGI